MTKQTIAVIMGGRSSEHEVSLVSGATVVRNIDKDRYDVIIIGITKDGQWKQIRSLDALENGTWQDSQTHVILSPETGKGELLLIRDDQVNSIHVDVVFPVLHGMNGEDGTIQGLFELAQIPYVGCGVLASACGMDKFYTKTIVDREVGIRQAEFVGVRRHELSDMKKVIDKVEKRLSYPVFVKPSKAGSSQGVSKAFDSGSLAAALVLAAKHDNKILVEETIRGREIECAVLGSRAQTEASGVGEVLAAEEFYSYDAKYNNEDSRTVVDPDLPEGKADEIRNAAVAIYRALDCEGLSRVDFFVAEGSNEVVFNEINTLPGFTAISMYPMLWEAKGLSKEALIDKLIELAFARYDN